MEKTLVISENGDLQIPQEFRNADHLTGNETFRMQRLSPGQYLLQKLPSEERPKTKLVREANGLLVFHPPPGSPVITTELVKRLEAETL